MRYHVRRKDKEITDENVMKKILKDTKYVTIAMSKDDKPYLVSLSHGYDDESNLIYFHCAKEGKKIDYLKENNDVWGQAILDYGYQQGECSHIYASVQFTGKVVFVENLEEKTNVVSIMIRHLDDTPEKLIEDLKSESLEKTLFGKIEIEYMTGKKSEEVVI